MNFHSTAIASLVCAFSLMGAQTAHAATPAGQITQLQGFVMAVKPGGGLKLLSSQSVVEVGDTLMSEQGSYVRVDLPGGRTAVLGPQTRLQVTSANRLELKNGQLRVTASDKPNADPLAIAAGGTTIDAGNASFDLQFVPDPASAVALTGPAATRARLGTLGAPAGVQVAQAALPAPVATPIVTIPGARAVPGFIQPGLYFAVTGGFIAVSNPAGSLNFMANQFGYTANVTKPPVLVPTNPGIQFTLPVAFNSTSTQTGSNSSGKAGAVDCEVR